MFFSVFGDASEGEDFDPEDARTVASPPDDRPKSEHKASPAGLGRAGPAHERVVVTAQRGAARTRIGAEVEVPLAMASDEELLATQELRRARAARARAALPADVAPRARNARCGARAATRRDATGSASTCGGPCAPACAPAGDPDPPRASAPTRRPPEARDAVRHLRLDGALRARLPAVPDLRRRQRSERRGVRVRHAADPPDPRAGLAQPGARDPARRRRRARLVERDPDRRRAEGRSTTGTDVAAWPAAP